MKTQQSPPQWLTDDMESSGMTLTVMNYLSGKMKKLKDSLSWIEFIMIWSVLGEVFEKTAYFQKRIIWISKTQNDPIFFEEIKKEMIPKHDAVEKFFMKFLPFRYALFLCDDFWSCYRLSDRRNLNRAQKKQLLEKILEITNKQILDREMLRTYANLAEGSKTDQLVVSVLISNFMLTNPKEMFFFRDNLSTLQINGMCEYWSKQMDVPEDDLFSLYKKVHMKEIPQAILSVITKDGNEINLKWLYERLVEKVWSMSHEKDSHFEIFRKDWFPVISEIIEKSNISHETGKLLMALPVYDSSNPKIVSIVERLVDQSKNQPYGMSDGAFENLYQYARIPLIPKAYIEGYIKSPDHLFKGIVKVFNICKEEQIIDAAVKHGLPTVQYAEENIIFFLDWLKESFPLKYAEAKDVITSTGVMQKVWEKSQKYDHAKFIKFAEHFI
jgi:hypothetical protein